jgi:hypothetical protein
MLSFPVSEMGRGLYIDDNAHELLISDLFYKQRPFAAISLVCASFSPGKNG